MLCIVGHWEFTKCISHLSFWSAFSIGVMVVDGGEALLDLNTFYCFSVNQNDTSLVGPPLLPPLQLPLVCSSWRELVATCPEALGTLISWYMSFSISLYQLLPSFLWTFSPLLPVQAFSCLNTQWYKFSDRTIAHTVTIYLANFRKITIKEF